MQYHCSLSVYLGRREFGLILVRLVVTNKIVSSQKEYASLGKFVVFNQFLRNVSDISRTFQTHFSKSTENPIMRRAPCRKRKSLPGM